MFGKKKECKVIEEIVDINVSSEKFKQVRSDLCNMLGTLTALTDSLNLNFSKVNCSVEDMQTKSKEYTDSVNSNCNEVIALDKEFTKLMGQLDVYKNKLQSLSSIFETIETNLSDINNCSKALKQGKDSVEKSYQELKGVAEKALYLIENSNVDFSDLIDLIIKVKAIAIDTSEGVKKLNKLTINATIEASRSEENSDKYKVVAKEINDISDKSINSTNELMTILDSMLDTFRLAESGKTEVHDLSNQKEKINSTITNNFSFIEAEINNLDKHLNVVIDEINKLKTGYIDCTTDLVVINSAFEQFDSKLKDSINSSNERKDSFNMLLKLLETTRNKVDILNTSVDLACSRYTDLVKYIPKLENL